jgi:hypothetical protein
VFWAPSGAKNRRARREWRRIESVGWGREFTLSDLYLYACLRVLSGMAVGETDLLGG